MVRQRHEAYWVKDRGTFPIPLVIPGLNKGVCWNASSRVRNSPRMVHSCAAMVQTSTPPRLPRETSIDILGYYGTVVDRPYSPFRIQIFFKKKKCVASRRRRDPKVGASLAVESDKINQVPIEAVVVKGYLKC